MKPFLMLSLALAVFSLAAPLGARATEVCGLLKGECLNGGHCARFIGNSSGDHAVFAADPQAETKLSSYMEKNVCAEGMEDGQGLHADHVSLSDLSAAIEDASEDAICLHNVECAPGFRPKAGPGGCLRCEKEK